MSKRVWGSWFFAVVVLLNQPLYSADKTVDEHWSDVGLSFAVVSNKINQTSCEASVTHFIACVHTLRAVINELYENQTLVTAERAASDPAVYGSVEKTIGKIVLVNITKPKVKTFAEALSFMRVDKVLSQTAWEKAYAERANDPIDYVALVELVTQAPEFAAKESVLTANAANTYNAVLTDPHTAYEPYEYFRQENLSGPKTFFGIGAMLKPLEKDGKTSAIVHQPMEGGPAYKAGIRANDVITHVDGVSTEGLDLQAVVAKVRGEKGAVVKVTVQRGLEVLDFDIARDAVEQKNVEYKMTGSNSDIAYVKLNDFMAMKALPSGGAQYLVYKNMTDAISALAVNKPKAMILDLRDNPGGLLPEAVNVASLFLKKGSLALITRQLVGNLEEFYPTDKERLVGVPMVVLINSRSASASEIVAGALQDQERAFIVGERSFGKGTVQSQVRVAKDISLRRTIQRFYLPSDRTNQVEGVIPDIEAYPTPNPTAEDKVNYREEDEYAALPKVGAPWKQPRPEVIEKLERCVATYGTAKDTFAAEASAAIPPDYQRLVAEDVVECVRAENLWSKEQEPKTPKYLGPSLYERIRLSLQADRQEPAPLPIDLAN